MTKYIVNGEEFENGEEAYQEADDLFWNCGEFEEFWRNEVDALQVFEELGRLGSPLYYDLLDNIYEKVCESIEEVETDESEDES